MKIGKTLVAGMVSVAALSVFAQEEEEETPQAATPAVSATAKVATKVNYSILPLCRMIDGGAEVCKPRGEWVSAEEGKFYPLGSSFRTGKSGRLLLDFGGDVQVIIEGEAAFGTLEQGLDVKSRTVIPQNGTINFKLPDNLQEGMFEIVAPGFTVKNPAGESRIVYSDTGDGDKAVVRCITGMMSVEGRHFSIPLMRAANEVIIQTSHDHLSTQLLGTSGDYPVKLDFGLANKEEIDDSGKRKTITEPRVSEWRLSPTTRVLINRAVPAIGERMSVHIMAFDAAGERKSECYFCEGRAEINSGELVAKDKAEGDVDNRAAEATETTADADEEEATTDSGSENNNESSEEE